MTDAPRVAVIIPCYNDGAVAEEAFDSISEDEPVEVVIVDDGSTDADTESRLAGLERRGARVVRSQNGGPGAARTAGFRATSAPLVYPLDADDMLVPGGLAAMADTLEREPAAGFAWGNYELFRLVGLGVEGISVDRVVYRRRLTGGGRQVRQDRLRHRDLYAELKRANADVFAQREALRARERPAAWKRLVYPVLFGPRKFVPFAIEAFLQRMMMRLGTGLPG
jgi:glycosyltransferase involved in cell wall biosynthesis